MTNSEITTFENYGSGYQHIFAVDNNTQVIKRIRYNFWMALGDIGGFYDGLKLLLSFFMAPIAALFYENDLLRHTLFAQKLT